jgi:hypothetical protein
MQINKTVVWNLKSYQVKTNRKCKVVVRIPVNGSHTRCASSCTISSTDTYLQENILEKINCMFGTIVLPVSVAEKYICNSEYVLT